MNYFKLLLIIISINSCVSVSKPFYEPVESTKGKSDITIQINRIRYVGKVDGNWWGERFFRINLTVINSSPKYQFINFCSESLNENNLKYGFRNEPEIKNLYYNNPEMFNINSFFKKTKGLMFLSTLSGSPPEYKYNGKNIFPTVEYNGKENLAAALVACEFGVPLLGAIVDSSQNTTGWIAPGNSKTLKLHFSIPHGESPIALVYEDYINAFLQEVP
jgi:hypothetical protein